MPVNFFFQLQNKYKTIQRSLKPLIFIVSLLKNFFNDEIIIICLFEDLAILLYLFCNWKKMTCQTVIKRILDLLKIVYYCFASQIIFQLQNKYKTIQRSVKSLIIIVWQLKIFVLGCCREKIWWKSVFFFAFRISKLLRNPPKGKSLVRKSMVNPKKSLLVNLTLPPLSWAVVKKKYYGKSFFFGFSNIQNAEKPSLNERVW